MRSIALFTALSLISLGFRATPQEVVEPQPREAPVPAAHLAERVAEVPAPARLVQRAVVEVSPDDREIFERIADCESGKWNSHDQPIAGSADWGSEGYFDGGLQFESRTWLEFRDPEMPWSAAYASQDEEIRVAVRVLKAQGWAAWPVCSWKVGVE